MSLENIQMIDNEIFDKSILKRDFIKVQNHQGERLNDPDQNMKIIFWENHK